MPSILALVGGILLAAYLIAGGIWTALPYLTITCPTGAGGHGPLGIVTSVIAWPADALRVINLVDSRALTFEEARMLRFCPAVR